MSLEETGATAPEVKSNPAEPPAPKRGPGRPRKAAANGAAPPLPETAVPGDAPAPRRGRPPKRAAEIDAGMLAKQIQGIHKMAAMMTGLPFVELSDQESVMLAESLANVSREYDLSVDGKTGATIQLLGVAAIIYVPRVVHFRQLRADAIARAQAEREQSGAPAIN